MHKSPRQWVPPSAPNPPRHPPQVPASSTADWTTSKNASSPSPARPNVRLLTDRKDPDLDRKTADLTKARGTDPIMAEDRNMTKVTDRVTISVLAMAVPAADSAGPRMAVLDPDRKDPNTGQVLKAPAFVISVATVDSNCRRQPSNTWLKEVFLMKSTMR